MGQKDELYSERTTSSNGKRTYFFNVKQNRNSDIFLQVVESKHRANTEGFERHQIVIFEEDIDSFVEMLGRVHKYVSEKPDNA